MKKLTNLNSTCPTDTLQISSNTCTHQTKAKFYAAPATTAAPGKTRMTGRHLLLAAYLALFTLALPLDSVAAGIAKAFYLQTKLPVATVSQPNNPDPQVVTGKVIDSATNLPISGVSIIMKGSTLGTVTDKSGTFSLDVTGKAKGKFTLVLMYVGYKPLEKSYALSELNSGGGSFTMQLQPMPAADDAADQFEIKPEGKQPARKGRGNQLRLKD